MEASVSVDDLSGNQKRLLEALGKKPADLPRKKRKREKLSILELRAEVRRRALEDRGLRVGSKVLYPGYGKVTLFIVEIDCEGARGKRAAARGTVVLSSRDPLDPRPMVMYPIGVRVSIKRFLENYQLPESDLVDGGKTWVNASEATAADPYAYMEKFLDDRLIWMIEHPDRREAAEVHRAWEILEQRGVQVI